MQFRFFLERETQTFQKNGKREYIRENICWFLTWKNLAGIEQITLLVNMLCLKKSFIYGQ